MKCVFSTQFKQFIKELSIVTIGISSLTLLFMFSVVGIGYASIHWFDCSNLVTVTRSDISFIHYYFIQGFYMLLFVMMGMIALLALYAFILYPIYYLIRYYKKVLNFIFTCKVK